MGILEELGYRSLVNEYYRAKAATFSLSFAKK